MAVWYLDNDDEITDAVARLRGTSDEHVVFVVPPGSRIATGRINFRLLSREADARGKEMAVASRDQQVRALAAAAGVLVAATAEEAEAALERGDEPASPATSAVRGGDRAETTSDSAVADADQGTRRLTWGSQRARVMALTALVLVVVGLFAASQLLPTATITLEPRVAELGPLEVAVVALPTVSEVDAAGGRIPAVTLPIPLEVRGTFSASGTEAREERATGSVVFASPEQPNEQLIPAGTRVRTPAGVEFQTTATVTLPPTEGAASQVSVPIEAIRSGEDGNVSAGAISVVPSLEEQGISVRNPEPTTGGRFEQTPRVTAEDYDAAAVDLQNRLAGALVAYLRDPANAPDDLELYAETAQLGPVRNIPAFEELVGASETEFELRGEVMASVLAVDPTLLDEAARTRLQAAVPEGMRLLPDTVRVEPVEGTADGQRVHYDTRAQAQVVAIVDPSALVDQVAGLTVSEAQAILERFGTATVSVWPEFLDGLPADRERIELDVSEPSTTE